jgi:Flp pilus assembly protein TadB
MGDDDAEQPELAEVPVSRWMRRSTPEEDRERDEVRTDTAIVRFYALIPLMVVAILLPAGPIRSAWVALVVAGFSVWLVLRATRASRRRRAAAAVAASDPPPPAAGE